MKYCEDDILHTLSMSPKFLVLLYDIFILLTFHIKEITITQVLT